MKRNKTLHRAVAFLLAVLLLLGVVAPALAVGETEAAASFDGEIITINSAEDLLALARHCTLDTWSRNKTVVLQTDISLAGISFTTIPIFGGTFDGAGHTISGLSVDESVYPAGLFGVVERGAVVKNLKVSGNVVPSGDADTMGGIVGINYGKLTDCTFRGLVSGRNTVGGVVGLNETTGQLINCRFQGAVTGEHYVGGVAGQNFGSLIQCENSGSINTTEVDVDVSIPNLTLQKLHSTENLPASTDIGGVAGFSVGLIQSCRNTGNVGYEHMGYNVGGIVGRQSGYLDGCVNSGTIRGRKDVGGIAGQMEPQVTLKYNEDTLSSLWDELDVLEELMDHALDDAQSASTSISESMNGLTASVGAAKDTAVSLSDAMVDWANSNIDQVNDASARLSWVLNRMEPVMDDLGYALEQAEIAAGQFSDALDDAELAAEWGNEAVAALEAALTDLQNASADGRNAYTHVESAMTHLENSLGDTAKTKPALKELADAAADMAAAFSEIAGAMYGIGTALDQVYQDAQEDENWQNLRSGVDDLRSALVEISGALAQVRNALETLRQVFDDPENEPTNRELLKEAMDALNKATAHLDTAYQAFSAALEAYENGDIYGEGGAIDQLGEGMTALNDANGKIQRALADIYQIVENVESDPRTGPALENLADGLADLNKGLGHANAAIVKIDTALQAIEDDPRFEATTDEIYGYLTVINREMETLSKASGRISKALKDLNGNLKPDEVDLAWTEIKNASAVLKLAAGDLDKAVGNLKLALSYLETAGGYGSDTMSNLNKASETMGKAIALLRQATEKTSDVIHELAEKPAIEFTPITSDLTEQGDALDDALSQVLDQVDRLNNTMTSSSDLLLADLRAINRQVGVIIDLLRQASDETKEESSDRFEDISDQELSDDRTAGRISNARNAGVVEGDINVAGIVGAMAIEYDFDPEDDLTESGDRSLDFRYQAVAVVKGSVNEGTVTAKKNYAGGIVGRMDLGTVYACQGYGSVKSTSGDYVGGIAGLSRAAIRNCYAKCTLAGEGYIGGIIGAGEEDSIVQECCTLVRVTDYEQYAGAISGSEKGTFTGNCFVSEELAGLGRVSYAGKAEPISYQDLSVVEGLPAPFQSFTLRFVADDTVLKTERFDFGACFDGDVYPDIPEKEGCFAQWDLTELNDLCFDTVVTAVYAPYITALSSDERRDGGRPVFYVEGKFQSGDSMQAQMLTADTIDLQAIPGSPFWKREVAELWQVCFADDGQDIHTVRYLRPDGKTQIYTKQNGVWERAGGEEIGRYLTFSVEGDEVEIIALSISLARLAWILLMASVLLLLLLLSAVRRGKRKKQARLVAAQAIEEEKR